MQKSLSSWNYFVNLRIIKKRGEEEKVRSQNNVTENFSLLFNQQKAFTKTHSLKQAISMHNCLFTKFLSLTKEICQHHKKGL